MISSQESFGGGLLNPADAVGRAEAKSAEAIVSRENLEREHSKLEIQYTKFQGYFVW